MTRYDAASNLLKIGSQGQAVKLLQQDLQTLGFNPVDTNGIFTHKTKSAVIQFQKSRPWLDYDGKVGRNTEAALTTAIELIEGHKRLSEIASNGLTVPLVELKREKVLVRYLQMRLKALGLYRGGRFVDSEWGRETEGAFSRLIEEKGLSGSTQFPNALDSVLALKLLDVKQLPSVLQSCRDQAKVFSKFKDDSSRWIGRFRRTVQNEHGDEENYLAFLDRGIEQSPYGAEIQNFLQSLEATIAPGMISSTPLSVAYADYPDLGVLPTIDSSGLTFIASDITEACVCLGNYVTGDPHVKVRWLGRNALNNTQCLSATKYLQILKTFCDINQQPQFKDLNVCECQVKESVNSRGEDVASLITDIVSYRNGVSNSNGLALTFKLFSSVSDLENWINRTISGSNDSSFRFSGKYLDRSPFESPIVFSQPLGSILTNKSTNDDYSGDNNRISTYILTRFISMLGWHRHLALGSQFPGANWESLKGVVLAMGTDTARYFDVALETLGLENVVKSPVCISKLGYGPSAFVYAAFIQFIDEHTEGQSRLRSLAIALRVKKNNPPGVDSDDIRGDSAIAAAVTEIIRRIITEELV
jgi:Putative peptidoglycan binding domain